VTARCSKDSCCAIGNFQIRMQDTIPKHRGQLGFQSLGYAHFEPARLKYFNAAASFHRCID
jgi:hypothetical protein